MYLLCHSVHHGLQVVFFPYFLRYLLLDSLPSSLLICFLSQYSELCVSYLFCFYVFALYAHLHHKRIYIQHHWQKGDSMHSLDSLQKSFCRQRMSFPHLFQLLLHSVPKLLLPAFVPEYFVPHHLPIC